MSGFVNIGENVYVNKNEILSVHKIESWSAKERVREAKKEDRFMNGAGNKKTRTALYMRNNMIYSSSLTIETIIKRLEE